MLLSLKNRMKKVGEEGEDPGVEVQRGLVVVWTRMTMMTC